MKRIIRLTESDLARIVRRVINEQSSPGSGEYITTYLNKVQPNLQASATMYDGDTGWGDITLGNGEKLYFKCDLPYIRKKDKNTPLFAKNTPEYNTSLNILRTFCKSIPPMGT
jgi:hypothetical protein